MLLLFVSLLIPLATVRVLVPCRQLYCLVICLICEQSITYFLTYLIDLSMGCKYPYRPIIGINLASGLFAVSRVTDWSNHGPVNSPADKF